MHPRIELRRWQVLFAAILTLGIATDSASAALVVAGSPGWQPATGGLRDGFTSNFGTGVNNNGVAIAYSVEMDSTGATLGQRGVRWDGAETFSTKLGNLGVSTTGTTDVYAYAINEPGVAVGSGGKYDASGNSLGSRALRWDPGALVATELGNLGTSATGVTSAAAYAVNDAGMSVGVAGLYNGGVNNGQNAVRWNASGTATALASLGSANGVFSFAYAINSNGVAVGTSRKDISGNSLGTRAVRWNSGGSAATELVTLGTTTSGIGNAAAYSINDAGTAIGQASKFSAAGTNLGDRAVRWNASGTAATELGNLGTNATGFAHGRALAISKGGTIVGYASKYDAVGTDFGQRGVRWDAGTTVATELSNLGTDVNGFTFASASGVNEAGTAVGVSRKYSVSGTSLGDRAVIWLPDASVIDLNDLAVVATSGDGEWVLTTARGISEDGYVVGSGTFTPTGGTSYVRHWVGQVGLGGDWVNIIGTTNTWGKGKNWSTGTPAIQLDANFNSNASYTVAFDDDETARNVTITSGTVTFAMDNHSLTPTTGLTVASSAQLNSDGTIAGNVLNRGTLSPGNSPGTLNITGNLSGDGDYIMEIASLLTHDEIRAAGMLSLDASIIRVQLAGYAPVAEDNFDLFDFTGAVGGTYAFNFDSAPLASNLAWDTSTFATTGAISVVTVPEPASCGLLAMGCLAIARRRRL